MAKHQAPSTKLQRSFKLQDSSLQWPRLTWLAFGHWFFSGVWKLFSSLEIGALFLVLLTGCSVGPNYQRPSVHSPATFRGDGNPTNNSFADLDWWNVYKDATLQALVREAFTNNYDLRIAVTRVEQASALAMQARSQFVPSMNYNATVSRGR